MCIRDSASVAGVTKFISAKGGSNVVGYLMQKEIDFLGNAVENPVRPVSYTHLDVYKRQPSDVKTFLGYAAEENLEAVEVAVVTEEPRLVVEWRGKEIVNISRAFLDTNGAHQELSLIHISQCWIWCQLRRDTAWRYRMLQRTCGNLCRK